MGARAVYVFWKYISCKYPGLFTRLSIPIIFATCRTKQFL